ncbi:hypothetical protein BN1211_0375 [Cyberlindnera jadinii]|uniref:Chromatin modification-related protein EAF7 n=1 Tax=Cyberlindnera jadinii (strain ATCC 18201 / CBS 1600 / BCRC 20928 / JCM 3617 / NBRC 0987 / NRRL Y-1542) TaxID=983966 RepID=A0A0H5BYQ7_CYBJN|nr:hypothetical protein BN1211_0375 [Cyberlindnera jadinii]
MVHQWTTEEDIVLLRSICLFKPVGQKKHFHMIAILKALNNGRDMDDTISAQDVWDKLAMLYDLEGLDSLEDEDESTGDDDDRTVEEKAAKGTVHDFSLPTEKYSDIMEDKARAVDSTEVSETDGVNKDAEKEVGGHEVVAQIVKHDNEGKTEEDNAEEEKVGDEGESKQVEQDKAEKELERKEEETTEDKEASDEVQGIEDGPKTQIEAKEDEAVEEADNLEYLRML